MLGCVVFVFGTMKEQDVIFCCLLFLDRMEKEKEKKGPPQVKENFWRWMFVSVPSFRCSIRGDCVSGFELFGVWECGVFDHVCMIPVQV